MTTRAEQAAATLRMNLNRDNELQGLIDGSTPTDAEGWRRISRHAASVNSAYKCMAILRLKWPMIEFQVRTPETRQRWKGEVWGRRKTQ